MKKTLRKLAAIPFFAIPMLIILIFSICEYFEFYVKRTPKWVLALGDWGVSVGNKIHGPH